MKKLLVTLLISLCFISGCSIIKVSDKSITDIFDTILFVDNDLSNTYMEGYSLYLPKGIKVVDKSDYNLIIKSNNNYYYVYVDTVAYYYKVENAFVEKNNHFFSKKINNKDKIGYVDISTNGDYYYIVIMYNYTKIETIVKKEEFNNSIVDMSSILSSIKYNDRVIEGRVGNDKSTMQEERFNIFDSNIENDNFLKYEDEYGTYKEKIDTNIDNDIIDVDETIE